MTAHRTIRRILWIAAATFGVLSMFVSIGLILAGVQLDAGTMLAWLDLFLTLLVGATVFHFVSDSISATARGYLMGRTDLEAANAADADPVRRIH